MLDGLTALCVPYHSAKTARGVEAGAVRTTLPRKGCTADGLPLDPAHPWRQAKSLKPDDPTTALLPFQSISFDSEGRHGYKRGPGAGRLKLVASKAEVQQHEPGPLFGRIAPIPLAPKPWEAPGMPADEQVLAFLRELPIVQGLRWQAGNVVPETDAAGNRKPSKA